jgi:hypothetical protein
VIIGSAQVLFFLVLSLAVFAVQVWAVVDAAVRPAATFRRAGKRTKTFWLSITGAAAALGFIAIPRPLGVGISGPFALVGVASLIATIVYLVDVRPAVRTYSGRRGRRGRSAGDRGGW